LERSITRPFSRLRASLLCGLLLLATALGGCASTGHPRDPLEPLNRGIYSFNEHVDNLIVKPAAEVYRGVLPQLVRNGIGNFFANLGDVIVALNNLLQGKFTHALSDIGRIVVNTTVGILGFVDVATELGLEKHNEDFGQTLGYWGFGDGPYLVLPFLGPSSLRDTIGLIVDYKTNPLTYVDPTRDRNALYGLNFVHRRHELLETTKILETAALDPYEFVRDAYFQRRRSLVYDGLPPREEDENEIKPKPGASLPAFPPTEWQGESVLVSGDYHDPTPAEIEARERERRAAAQAPRAELPPPPRPAARVVRVWLPAPRD
jgi:phospholipid-binding lipoprotein MlaA